MIRKLKRYVTIVALALVFSFSIFFFTVLFFEKISLKNSFVLLSKRLIAEVSAFEVNHIYDPYKGKYKIARFYPPRDKTSKFQGFLYSEEQISQLIKEKLPARLGIVKFNNQPIVKSHFDFYYQPYDENKLAILRKTYHLDEVIKGSKDEYQSLIRLKNWVAGRWKFGKTKDAPYNFDALEILRRAGEGERFFCSEYSTVFVQCALSLGFNARYVGLIKGHVVAEVWSNQFNKWIVLDPTFNIRYMKDGVPLNSLELHVAWIKGQWWKIDVVADNPQPRGFGISDYKFKLIDYYENFYIRMRNDWFTNKYPHWYPLSNSIMNGLEWQDGATSNSISIARESSKPEDLYWSLDRTNIKMKLKQGAEKAISFEIYLDTFTPNFRSFVISVDSRSQMSSDPDFIWTLHKGRNALSVKSVNEFGVAGVESRIELEVGS